MYIYFNVAVIIYFCEIIHRRVVYLDKFDSDIFHSENLFYSLWLTSSTTTASAKKNEYLVSFKTSKLLNYFD